MPEVDAAPGPSAGPSGTVWLDEGGITELSFTVEIGLGDLQQRDEEVREEISAQLDANVVIESKGPAGTLQVTLVVPGTDLWLSLLLAMAAVTRTGYSPRTVEAMPTADFHRRRQDRRAATHQT